MNVFPTLTVYPENSTDPENKKTVMQLTLSFAETAPIAVVVALDGDHMGFVDLNDFTSALANLTMSIKALADRLEAEKAKFEAAAQEKMFPALKADLPPKGMKYDA